MEGFWDKKQQQKEQNHQKQQLQNKNNANKYTSAFTDPVYTKL